jgi:hypothetical protein
MAPGPSRQTNRKVPDTHLHVEDQALVGRLFSGRGIRLHQRLAFLQPLLAFALA